MLTKKLPFEGDARDLMYAHVNEQSESPAQTGADVGSTLDRLVMQLMEKNPADRIQSMQEVSLALRELNA